MAAVVYSEKIYGKLLAKTLPSVVTSDKEYARMEADFNKLMDKDSLTLEENRLCDLLATLLENYELQKLLGMIGRSPGVAEPFDSTDTSISPGRHGKPTNLDYFYAQ